MGVITLSGTPQPEWRRSYDLQAARKLRDDTRSLFPHQTKAVSALNKWYGTKWSEPAGGLLVLPTGGGKTLTATRFLCQGPLSEGYKVLWLAHAYHLLEQAISTFGPEDPGDGPMEVRHIHEPRRRLNARVVSGAVGHWPVRRIEADDDVIFSTHQTMNKALDANHPALDEFLASARGKLFIVFDEAHHSPAPTYRHLIERLRKRASKAYLLGLTATPTYTDEKKRPWLGRLYPQDIIFQEEYGKLMAAGILARPIFEEPKRTEFVPSFTHEQYQNWVRTFRDLPEEVIAELANSRERNALIASTYVEGRRTYGRTIMFTDSWRQCEMISEFLRKDGVRAGAIYSHVDRDPGNAPARARRTGDENHKVLEQFRQGKLDVLLNIKMATEGTDVPGVQSVFLTRQTTSEILLNQMIGRGLRGPKVGGVENTRIVSFIDDWRERIQWSTWTLPPDGEGTTPEPEIVRRPALQLISIDLVREACRMMDEGLNIAAGPYLEYLPIGWYRTEFEGVVNDTDETMRAAYLVLVYAGEEEAYRDYMTTISGWDLEPYVDPAQTYDKHESEFGGLAEHYFGDGDAHVGKDLPHNLFHILRHMAQNDGERPDFFAFEERDNHDLDQLAQDCIDKDLGPQGIRERVLFQYSRRDRLWSVLYGSYESLKSHCDACINRILDARELGKDPRKHYPVREPVSPSPELGITEEIKRQVFLRDGQRCLCCGATKRLQVDHIVPRYYGGTDDLENLQMLCSRCNGHKGIAEMNFRVTKSCLREAPVFEPVYYSYTPTDDLAALIARAERDLRATINCFYQCAAVSEVIIKQRGEGSRRWHVKLYAGNDPSWIAPHLESIVPDFADSGFPDLEEIVVS